MKKQITIITLLAAILLSACSSSSDEVSPDTPSPTRTTVPVTFSTYLTSDKTTRTLNMEHGTLNFEHGTLNFEHGSSNVESSKFKSQSSKFKVESSKSNVESSKFYGEITDIETLRKTGFAVFGYYTGASAWSTAGATTTPNFMYNQQVTWNGDDKKQNSAGQTPNWLYEPVKFWPNGESNAGSGVADDKVSFFSYAPYTEIQNSKFKIQNYDMIGGSDYATASGIYGFSTNESTGSTKIAYRASSDPEKSIDLLWGVAPTPSNSSTPNTNHPSPGFPFLDQTKQSTTEDITFQFKHALAKLNIIMFGNFGSDLDASDSTMVLLKKVKITHRVPKEGVLDLNNTEAGSPAWDKESFVFDNTADDATTTDFNEENTSTIELATEDIPDTLLDIDYGTDPDGWKARFNKGRGGIRNGVNINLHKGAFMLIPPDSATMAESPAGDRVLRVEVTYTVQTIDHRLPKKYWRHEETLTTFYPVHRIKAGMAYTIRLGLSLSAVSVTVKTEQWREPVVFANTVDPLDDNNFDIDPTPDTTKTK